MKAADLPNAITVFRILLVPPVVVLLLYDRFAAALIVFSVAGVSDALDGFLAKRFDWTSALGALLDPLADKLLLLCSFVTLGYQGAIPLWLVLLVIVRDLVIVGGALSYHFLIEPVAAAPSRISKLNTLLQILLVLGVMFNRGVQTLPAHWLHFLIYAVLASTLCSGLDYVWTWGRRAWRQHGT
jgi:cardiolipin synthase